MTAADLRGLTEEDAEALSPLLHAMWHDAHGDWQRAHELAQAIETSDGAWVHAYLHRREGDEWNAGYWYRQAKRPVCTLPLDDEWITVVEELLTR